MYLIYTICILLLHSSQPTISHLGSATLMLEPENMLPYVPSTPFLTFHSLPIPLRTRRNSSVKGIYRYETSSVHIYTKWLPSQNDFRLYYTFFSSRNDENGIHSASCFHCSRSLQPFRLSTFTHLCITGSLLSFALFFFQFHCCIFLCLPSSFFVFAFVFLA